MEMRTLKQNLFAAVMLLFVAALALGTATYAWFVANSAVTVETMDFTASGGASLEIALDTIGYQNDKPDNLAFKGMITLEDLIEGTGGGKTDPSKTYFLLNEKQPEGKEKFSNLQPVSTVNGNQFFTYRSFNGKEGKAEQFRAVSSPINVDYQAGKLEQYYMEIPLWLYASQAMNVYLGYETKITSAENPETVYALRTAFVPWEEDRINGYKPNYDKAVIWDPDNLVQNEGEAHHVVTSRNTTIFGSSPVTYPQGITSIEASSGLITAMQVQKITSTDRLITGIPAANTKHLTPEQVENHQSILHIPAGQKVKLSVYIWLDGVDYDCRDEISDGELSVYLQFIGAYEE